MQFLIKTDNKEYTGRSYGLPFNNGVAMLSEDTLDVTLGRSVEQVAVHLHRTKGYDVVPQGDESVEIWPSLLEPPKTTTGRKSVKKRNEKTGR